MYSSYRDNIWNWEENLGRLVGILGVYEDEDSDARRNLLWKKMVEVSKKGKSSYNKDSGLGGQIK